jgi:acyl-CoA synthetase (AMP-forming)/AMP-acid ligase II
LRTGDLGFQRDGELFVTGRIKDVIIIRGRKHYPQDLEHTVVSSHPAVRPNSSAAVSLPTPDGERLLILVEVNPRERARTSPLQGDSGTPPDLDELIGSVRQAMAQWHELQTHAVILVSQGEIPRTTSGKLQRHACRQRFLDGTLKVLAQWPRQLDTTSR